MAICIAVCDFGNVTVVVGKHLFEGDGCLRVGGLLDEMIAENLDRFFVVHPRSLPRVGGARGA